MSPSAETSRDALLKNDESIPLRDSIDVDSSDELSSTSSGIELTKESKPRAKRRARPTAKAYEKLPRDRRSLWRLLCRRPSRFCTLLSLAVVAALVSAIAGGGYWVYKTAPKDGLSPPWYPSPCGGTLQSWQDSYTKAQELVSKMSLISKVNITSGVGWKMELCVGNTSPAEDVQFPALCLQDGPLGIRFADQITALPAGITTGATWNRKLMHARGAVHGREARRKGVHVILGPCMGPLGRMPGGGRNWEGFGTDPVLQGLASYETILGIQEEGVIATAKHLVGQEQEHFRQSFEWGLPNALSTNIDDRTMHELYVWPFAESIRAGVGSVMCSYQMVNNSYTCGNSWIQNGIVKDELGFQGFIQSDWLAQRSGVASALAGLDMSMPGDGKYWADGNSYFGTELTLAALNGSLPMDRLNDMVVRVVAAWYQMGQDKWEQKGPNFSSWTNEKEGLLHPGSNSTEKAIVNQFVDAQVADDAQGTEHHSVIARKVAAEGTVVVKNEDSVLPLSRKGTGRSTIYKVGIYGEDAGKGNGPNSCEDRGCDSGTLAQGWGSGSVEFPYLIDPASALRDAFDQDSVTVTSLLENNLPPEKITEMADLDLCIAFANADSGEGYISYKGMRGDRNDLNLQEGGEDLVQSVVTGCGGDVVVVIHSVGPVVIESFADNPKVKAIVFAHLPGEESGNALVDVLFGDVDASGRLPYTNGKSLADYGPAGQILYYPNGIVPQQDFNEGLYIDYRHFEKAGIAPRYPFGFGLSYTTFSWSDLTITPLQEKSALPATRPSSLSPPSFEAAIPNPEAALFPPGLRRIQKYVYSYIDSVGSVKSGTYPYPSGYHTARPPSPAGGGEGGNPSLYEPFLKISLTLKNTGQRKGQEVVQIYLSFPDNVVEPATQTTSEESIDFPARVLRNFEKYELDAGEERRVEVNLTRKDLSYWSVVRQNWVMPVEGEFGILVGKHARDVQLRGTF
ncbi:MAG: hypothetical protein Q9227_007142 [Pyrenula ochraceoflavens]